MTPDNLLPLKEERKKNQAGKGSRAKGKPEEVPRKGYREKSC